MNRRLPPRPPTSANLRELAQDAEKLLTLRHEHERDEFEARVTSLVRRLNRYATGLELAPSAADAEPVGSHQLGALEQSAKRIAEDARLLAEGLEHAARGRLVEELAGSLNDEG